MLEESGSSGTSECLVLLDGRSGYLVQQREPHVAQSVSLGFSSLELVSWDHCSSNDVDGVSSGTMSAGHVHV